MKRIAWPATVANGRRAIVAGLVLSLGLATASRAADDYPASWTPKIKAAEAAVRKELAVPDSAKFENEVYSLTNDAVCGFVSAKNGAGADTPATPFVVVKTGHVLFVQTRDPKDPVFEDLKRICVP